MKRCQIRRFASQNLIRVCRTSEVSGDAFFSPILNRLMAFFEELCFFYLEQFCIWCDYICTNSCGVSKSAENVRILVLS